VSEVRRARRYYFLQRLAAHERCEPGLEAALRGKQEEQPGTLFASDFPFKASLEAAGYLAIEDVDGADCHELREKAGLDQSAAQAVIAAAAALI
jgi:hypothetical protein